MLQVNYLESRGVANGVSIMYFEFIFDNSSELPISIYTAGTSKYIIANESIAVSRKDNSWYKYANDNWNKQKTEKPELTNTTTITSNGNTNIADNFTKGFRSINVNVDDGTYNYEELNNKPSINNVELIGNKTSDDLNLVGAKSDGTNAEIFNNYEKNIAIGNYSTASGDSTTAYGGSSHAEGYSQKSQQDVVDVRTLSRDEITYNFKYGSANNRATVSYGYGSHAEGNTTLASGTYSHTEGQFTVAYGQASHAEGATGFAKGMSSHTEGTACNAIEDYSHAEGHNTFSLGKASHSEGYTQNNIIVTTLLNYDPVYDTKPKKTDVENTWDTTKFNMAYGDYSHTEGYDCLASGTYSHAEGNNTTARGECSHVEGVLNKSLATASHAEGSNTTASANYSHAEGLQTIASGERSHAEGLNTIASSYDCHAEGYYTIASSTAAHAEGYETQATNTFAHAEGYKTIASGHNSHAEGSETTASGVYSHSSGQGTKASKSHQTVIGKYNKEDTYSGGKYAFIIGSGSSDNSRSNAFAIEWDGTIHFNHPTYGNVKLVLNSDGTVTWTQETM